MATSPEPSGDKQSWRAHVLARRSTLSAAQHDATAAGLRTAVTDLAAGRPGPVAAYASLGTEPGTQPLLAALPKVLLPVLLPDGDLDWARYEGDLQRGPRGLLQPPGPRLGPDAVAACGVVVVPALAVDRSGTRLGRGGGSYDRVLARARGLVVVALHSGELVDALPAEPHDRPVHAVVLPDLGLVHLRSHPGGGPAGRPGGMAP